MIILGLAIVLSPSKLCAKNSGSDAEEQVCDPLADYYLGMEDYPAAIRLHQIVIREHPDNALAHYHLGFAYGVLGDHRKELMQYQQAVGLGLSDWQLFLNLGLLYMETGHLGNAAEVLRLSTLLGPNRPEAHFNLGLVYERLGMLRQAEQARCDLRRRGELRARARGMDRNNRFEPGLPAGPRQRGHFGANRAWRNKRAKAD